jgi:hypothetical protein
LAREWKLSDASGNVYQGAYLQSAANNAGLKVNNVTTGVGEHVVETGYTTETALAIRARVFDGAASGTVIAYRNGTQTNSRTGSDVNPVVGGELRILPRATNITLGSFLVTSSTSTETRLRHEGVMAWDKGLQTSLPLDHPYRSRRPIYQEWFPSDDPGLLIWYDFADSSTVTITGAGISSLLNKAGGGTYTLTQATDAYRPSWDGSVATGRGVDPLAGLRISTTVNWTNAAYLQLSTGTIGNFNASYAREWVTEISLASRSSLFIQNSTNNLRAKNGTTEWSVETGFTADTSLQMRGRVYDGVQTVTAYKNGLTSGQTGRSAADVTATVGDLFALLCNGATNITLGDFLVTSSTTTAIRQKHEGYLAWKRGLAANLDASHPYKTRPPLTTD